MNGFLPFISSMKTYGFVETHTCAFVHVCHIVYIIAFLYISIYIYINITFKTILVQFIFITLSQTHHCICFQSQIFSFFSLSNYCLILSSIQLREIFFASDSRRL